MIIEAPLMSGIRRSTGVVSITAASTQTQLYQVTDGRTLQIKKIAITNRNGSAAQVTLSTSINSDGSSSTQILPVQYVATGAGVLIREADIPRATRDLITDYLFAQSDNAGAAPNDVQIEVEFEEMPAGGTPATS